MGRFRRCQSGPAQWVHGGGRCLEAGGGGNEGSGRRWGRGAGCPPPAQPAACGARAAPSARGRARCGAEGAECGRRVAKSPRAEGNPGPGARALAPAGGAGTARRVSQMQGRTRGPPWPPAAALRRMPWPSAASGKSDLREATAQAPERGRVPSYRGGLLPPRPPGPTETATSASCPGRNIPCLSVPGPARGPGAT